MSIIRKICGAPAVVAVLVTGLSGAQPAQAQEAEVLAPSSPWNVDYGEDRCRLVRTFGEGENLTAMIMEQLGPSAHFDLVLAGKTLRRMGDSKPAMIQMGPAYEAIERDFQEGDLGELSPALIFGTLSPVHADLEGDDDPETDDLKPQEDLLHPEGATVSYKTEGIEWIEISQRNRSVRLSTGPMAKPLDALHTCSIDLLKTWGLDPEIVDSVEVGPKVTNIISVAKRIQGNYPSKALMRGQMATIQLRIIVNEQGHMESCTRLDVTEAENFTDGPCGVFGRYAEFEPARDASGASVRSYMMQRIRYLLP